MCHLLFIIIYAVSADHIVQISRRKVKISVNPWIYAKARSISMSKHFLSARSVPRNLARPVMSICTSLNSTLIMTNNPEDNSKSQVLLSSFLAGKLRLIVVTASKEKAWYWSTDLRLHTLYCILFYFYLI